MKVAGILASVLFALSACVQFNDPDPVPWVLAYATAAGIALAALLGRQVTWLAAAAGAAFTIGAVSLSPALGTAPMSELVLPEMKTIAIEEARESLGLALCAVWMTVLAVHGWRARQTATA